MDVLRKPDERFDGLPDYPFAPKYATVETAGVPPVIVAQVEEMLQQLRPLLGADGPPKVMHDAKSGLMVLAQRGVKTGTPAFDTQLAAFLLDGNVYDLEDLIADRLSGPIQKFVEAQ